MWNILFNYNSNNRIGFYIKELKNSKINLEQFKLIRSNYLEKLKMKI